ncbi:MAG TPA: hypothetical protein VGF94_17505 [Kofleriaceae bacterium]
MTVSIPAVALAGGGDDAAATAEAAATDQTTVTGTAPAIFHKNTVGISLAVPSGTLSGSEVELAYFTSDHTAYDLLFGVDLAHTPDAMMPATMGMPATTTPGGTTFGLTVGAGYRMYKHHSERIHTYLEPFALVSSADLGSAGDNLSIGVGGALGAECMFADWFSVRGQVGVALTFASAFKAIELATNTSGLYANFYW